MKAGIGLPPQGPGVVVQLWAVSARQQEREGSEGVSAVMSEGFGDVVGTGPLQESDGQVPQCCHHLGAVVGAGLGVVFPESDVPDPVQTVFDGPVTSEPAVDC